MLTRSIQIPRQREVQTDNDGLWWINLPGLGHFLLWTPNGVIILNSPRCQDSKQVYILYLNCKFNLHARSWHLCLSQHPRHQLARTPLQKKGKGKCDNVEKQQRSFSFTIVRKKRCSDLIETAESEYKARTASMSVSSWGWWCRSVAQLSCRDKH